MKKVLLVQFRTDSSVEHERECFQRFVSPKNSLEIDTISALDNTFEKKTSREFISEYAGIILGGSGEFYLSHIEHGGDVLGRMLKNTSRLIEHILQKDFPTFGVCFGHQLLGFSLGVPVVRDMTQAKIGTHEVRLQESAEKDSLFRSMPNNFDAQYGHKDTLARLPKDSVLLAQGERCNWGSFRYREHVYGAQFHPELTKDDILKKMLEHYPEYCDNPEETRKHVRECPDAPRIMENFLASL